MYRGILFVVEPHGSLLSMSLLRTTLVYYVLCGFISQSILPVTEVYDHTNVCPGAGVSSMSHCIKNKDVSEGKGSSPQDVSGFGDIKTADLFRMITEDFEKRNKKF